MFGDSSDAKGPPVRAGPLCCLWMSETVGRQRAQSVSSLITGLQLSRSSRCREPYWATSRSMAIWAQAALLGLFSGMA